MKEEIVEKFNSTLYNLLHTLDPKEIDENRIEIKRLLNSLSQDFQQEKIDKWDKYVDAHIANRNRQISHPDLQIPLQSIIEVFETILRGSENK